MCELKTESAKLRVKEEEHGTLRNILEKKLAAFDEFESSLRNQFTKETNDQTMVFARSTARGLRLQSSLFYWQSHFWSHYHGRGAPQIIGSE